jgi:hypothetical protein
VIFPLVSHSSLSSLLHIRRVRGSSSGTGRSSVKERFVLFCKCYLDWFVPQGTCPKPNTIAGTEPICLDLRSHVVEGPGAGSKTRPSFVSIRSIISQRILAIGFWQRTCISRDPDVCNTLIPRKRKSPIQEMDCGLRRSGQVVTSIPSVVTSLKFHLKASFITTDNSRRLRALRKYFSTPSEVTKIHVAYI